MRAVADGDDRAVARCDIRRSALSCFSVCFLVATCRTGTSELTDPGILPVTVNRQAASLTLMSLDQTKDDPPGGTSDQGSAEQSSDVASRSVRVQCPHAGCACRPSRPAAGTTTYSRHRHGRRQGRCLLRVVSANDTRSELWLLQSHLEGLRRAYPGAESGPWRLKPASRTPVRVTDSSVLQAGALTDTLRPSSSRHLAHAELLEEQQAVGVGPVLGELAAGDAQGVSAGEGYLPAGRLGCRAGEAAGVGAVRLPPHDQVLVVGDRPHLDDECQVGEDGVDAADPALQRLAAADRVGSRSGQRRRVSHEVLGDDLVRDAEVAVPQVFPRAGERGVSCVGHGGFLSWSTGSGFAPTVRRLLCYTVCRLLHALTYESTCYASRVNLEEDRSMPATPAPETPTMRALPGAGAR